MTTADDFAPGDTVQYTGRCRLTIWQQLHTNTTTVRRIVAIGGYGGYRYVEIAAPDGGDPFVVSPHDLTIVERAGR